MTREWNQMGWIFGWVTGCHSKRVRYTYNNVRSFGHNILRSGQVRACRHQVPETMPTRGAPLICTFWATTLTWLSTSLNTNVRRVALWAARASDFAWILDTWKLRLLRERMTVKLKANDRGRAWLALDLPSVGRGAEHGALDVDHMYCRITS